MTEQFVLVREPHCKGFTFGTEQSVPAYFQAQGLTEYYRFNDQLLQLLQHPKVRAGFRPTRAQMQQFILALYNVDMFRRELLAGRIKLKQPLAPMESRAIASGDDKSLLLLGVQLQDAGGRRPVHGTNGLYHRDPHWRDLVLFHEYFHGDDGSGVGASHQTGWTGVVAKLLQQSGE